MEDVDIKKAVSDMEKDQVLDQYKFFIGTAQKMQKMPNLGTDADGTCIRWQVDRDYNTFENF